MQAMAAETGASGAPAEAFYVAPEFWVAVAFVILIGAFGRKVYGIAVEALDKRSAAIQEQIDEATRLREEAQELLATYERKQRDAADDAKEIVERARREAEAIGDQAASALEEQLKRRQQMAEERIAQAENAAVEEVRRQAVEVAIEATRKVLSEQLDAKKADALVEKAIKELPDKLH
ncbi:MAG: F0F1 ATP synthase subunit B [Rhodospirillales bacterium]|nr:F0F1 ATP synthase subunit B [Rhodospirillales bacterium]